jgi:hypothetical protein
MRYASWIGIGAGLLIILSGFLPWGSVPVAGNTPLTGFGADSYSKFGKPVLFNLYLLPVLILFFLIPYNWAKKINPLIAAIGFAWAIRNLLLFYTCRNGECPTTAYGIYVYLLACFLLLLMTLLTRTKNN